MKFSELKTTATPTGPCELLSHYEAHEDQGGTLREFLLSFDFDSCEELRKAVWMIMDRAANDEYYVTNEKKLTARAASIHARFKRLDRSAKERDTFPDSVAQELWNGGYSRKKLDEATAALFSQEPDDELFALVSEYIQREYHFTDAEMQKLQFGIEQVKAGRNFPNSLRRMLYLWGDKKKTGKTTTASCIVEILNAYTGSYRAAQGFTTTLSNEMQIGGFKVPVISRCNVALMDECFYADMGKTYADFKRFLTSSDGRARLPYGQEFEWHGLPNYIATSNDPLRKFIKDWGDRRFLSIEFREKPDEEFKNFDGIKGMWLKYIVNSRRTKDWIDWSNEIAEIADEVGERTERCEEFEAELKQRAFLDYILTKQCDNNCNGENNKVFLKFFVDFFRDNAGFEIGKMRGEIEKAVLKVYGPKYSTQNYWRLSDLQKRAEELRDENCRYCKSSDDEIPATTHNMPF